MNGFDLKTIFSQMYPATLVSSSPVVEALRSVCVGGLAPEGTLVARHHRGSFGPF